METGKPGEDKRRQSSASHAGEKDQSDKAEEGRTEETEAKAARVSPRSPIYQQQVIDMIVHDEPAAVVPPDEARLVAAVQWAGLVARSAVVSVPSTAVTATFEDASPSDPIFLLHFNRNPKEMMSAVCEGVPLRAWRSQLLQEGFQWKLISGALVFVHPEQYRSTMQKLNGKKLDHSDIVVASSLEYLLEESIQTIGRSVKGVWAKSRILLQEDVCDDSLCAEASEVDTKSCTDSDLAEGRPAVLVYKRTFICAEPALRHMSSVVESTTAANDRVHAKPRRIMLE